MIMDGTPANATSVTVLESSFKPSKYPPASKTINMDTKTNENDKNVRPASLKPFISAETPITVNETDAITPEITIDKMSSSTLLAYADKLTSNMQYAISKDEK